MPFPPYKRYNNYNKKQQQSNSHVGEYLSITTDIKNGENLIKSLRASFRTRMNDINNNILSLIDNHGLGNITTEHLQDTLALGPGLLDTVKKTTDAQYVAIQSMIDGVKVRISGYTLKTAGGSRTNTLINGRKTLESDLYLFKRYVKDYLKRTGDNYDSASKGTLDRPNTADDNLADQRIIYPPTHVFPRNPEIAQYIKPIVVTERFKAEADTIAARVGKQVSSRKDSLEFDIGFGGRRNVIKLSSPIYIDYTNYDYTRNEWDERPIKVTVNTDSGATVIDDITNYFRRDVVSFADLASSLNDSLRFYFDGEKIITNYDFSNPDDRAKVTVTYGKLIDSIRVKAVLMTNSSSIIFKTPTVDQYTLVMGKQKVID